MKTHDQPKRCLLCYRLLAEDKVAGEYHEKCSRKFFGTAQAPELPYALNQINELAERVVRSRVTVPGVQPKLSLHLEKQDKNNTGAPRRLTIVGLWGMYIFKPPSPDYSELPEIEDATMHLAEIVGIKSVPHGLVRFNSGELGYITRRIDRIGKNGSKRHLEDLCQLTERLTEHKYRGSMEQVGQAIARYSSNPGIDLITFFEVAVFSFLVGNADMHLKNFSLVHDVVDQKLFISMAPAYDLIATKLVLPEDKEELALPLQGKKSNLGMKNFVYLGKHLEIDDKAVSHSLDRLRMAIPPMLELVDISFLSKGMKTEYENLIRKRARALEFI